MKYLFLFVTVILFYIVGFMRLDNIELTSMYYIFRYCFVNMNVEADIQYYYTMICKLLMVPFMDIDYLSRSHKGSIYSSYLLKTHYNDLSKFNSKYYWYNIFRQNGINTPKIVGYSLDNKKYIGDYDETKKYISKPNNGTLGYNVNIVSGKDIKNIINNNDNIIIQDKLYDCIKKKARIFRLVTLYNGESFVLWELTAHSSKQVTSNTNMGKSADIVLCKNIKCNISNIESKELSNIILKLESLHKMMYDDILSIGWDIMLDCTDTINMHVLEGNIMCSVVIGKYKVLMSKYKNIVKKYLGI
jgi:hypothetical protein